MCRLYYNNGTRPDRHFILNIMLLKDYLDIDLLNRMIDKGYVNVNYHPIDRDLKIYNYSAATQFERVWNDVTLKCRGLIVRNDTVVARPFTKIFNFDELTLREKRIASNIELFETFKIWDKVDGSLGILYWIDDVPFIATRGSFTSDQADHATNVLHNYYAHVIPLFDKRHTYLFEIIYPENRIVVDYKGLDDLILLAVIHTDTGAEAYPLPTIFDMRVVEEFPNRGLTFRELRELNTSNKEGFVIQLPDNSRFKLKFDDYVALHKAISGITNLTVWEALSSDTLGSSMNDLLAQLPDEMYQWLNAQIHDLRSKFVDIQTECNRVFKEFPTRKETAEYFMQQKYPSVLFSMLDGKNTNRVIWRLIKPKTKETYVKSNTNQRITS